jgi:hypothetical protein
MGRKPGEPFVLGKKFPCCGKNSKGLGEEVVLRVCKGINGRPHEPVEWLVKLVKDDALTAKCGEAVYKAQWVNGAEDK